MGERICAVEECAKQARSREWCGTHYERWRRHGDPLRDRWAAGLSDRFWSKVDASGDCWEWTAARNQFGYGQIGLAKSRKRGMAHRVAYELLVAEIPGGLELDHLCRNHGCVNPDHLEPVTHAENMRRAPWTAKHSKQAKTRCPQGHRYDGDNLYVNPQGRRECRTCRRDRR